MDDNYILYIYNYIYTITYMDDVLLSKGDRLQKRISQLLCSTMAAPSSASRADEAISQKVSDAEAELMRLRRRMVQVEKQLSGSCQHGSAHSGLKRLQEQKQRNAQMLAQLEQELKEEERKCGALNQENLLLENALRELRQNTNKPESCSTIDTDAEDETAPCLRVSRRRIEGGGNTGFISVDLDTVLVITTTEHEMSSQPVAKPILWYFGYALNRPEVAGWMKSSDTRAFKRSEFCR